LLGALLLGGLSVLCDHPLKEVFESRMRCREIGEEVFSLGRVRALSLQLLNQPHLVSHYAGALVDDVRDVFDVHTDSLIATQLLNSYLRQSTPARALWLRPTPEQPP